MPVGDTFFFRGFVVVVLALVLVMRAVVPGTAQHRTTARALKLTDKEKFEKAEKIILKSLEKDSLNPGSRYALGCLYFDEEYPKYNLDSAWYWAHSAQDAWDQADPKHTARLAKRGISRIAIFYLRSAIDSTGFENAKSDHTIDSYNTFINKFYDAAQREEAIKLRNMVAFEEATKINSYQSYQHYMETYPDAEEAPKARERYERLYFEESTSAGTLKSYLDFLKKHPTTPYRKDAEENIFLLSTADNLPESYKKFTNDFPLSFWNSKAKAMGYYAWQFHHPGTNLPIWLQTDSLRQVKLLEDGPWFPVFKGQNYAFMNTKGKITLETSFSQIDDRYICEGVHHDWIAGRDPGNGYLIIARNGSILASPSRGPFFDIGSGLILMGDNGGYKILHKAGFFILDSPVDSALVMFGQWVGFQRNGQWGIANIHGKVMADPQFLELEMWEDLIIASGKNSMAMISKRDLENASHQNIRVNIQWKYDDVEPWSDQLLWHKKGRFQGIVNTDLKQIFGPVEGDLFPLPFGLMLESQGKYRIYNKDYKLYGNEWYSSVTYKGPWVGVKNGHGWDLINMETAQTVIQGMDSLVLLSSRMVMGFTGDNTLLFAKGRQVEIAGSASFEKTILEKPGDPDSRVFLMFSHFRGTKVLFNDSLEEIFRGKADQIRPLAPGYLTTELGDKKGVISTQGRVLATPEYEAVAQAEGDGITLLLKGKFGYLNKERMVLIRPQFSRPVKRISGHQLVANHNGNQFLIDDYGKETSKIRFDEILPWNDSTILVKNDFRWSLYDFKRDLVVYTGIKNFWRVSESEHEKVLIIYRENEYGVISNKRGVVINPVYTTIINLGTAEAPFYFCEMHIEEADFFVVIYYDQKGNVMYKHAYESAVYEKVFCD